MSKKLFFLAILFQTLLLTSSNAFAHVQWFSTVDFGEKIPPLHEAFDVNWLLFALALIIPIYIAFILDRRYGDRFESSRMVGFLLQAKPYIFDGFRVSAGFFLISLWLIGGTILTPEMKTDQQWISWIQLLMAIALISRKTSFITGFGIIFLYFYAMTVYGVFHTFNYPIFLGVAGFLIFSSLEKLKKYEETKLMILHGTVVFTLMWASIEKFVYAHWYTGVLSQHSHILLGLDQETFMLLAAFTEFTLPFLMLVDSGFIARIATAPLIVVFLLAVIDFGKIDLVGHSLIIMSLSALFITGPSKLNRLFRIPKWPSYEESGALVGEHFLVLGAFITFYYLLHHVSYGF